MSIVPKQILASAGGEFSANTTLNEFIRRHAELRGTKYMCLEGGCGACVVNVRAVNAGTNELDTFSVNSCLVAIMSCDGWDITTVEGIGNRKEGYNVIQTRLNNFFGTQCGYCSPGFVMNMYSLVKGSDRHLTEAEIENSFGSNLCRCTGYRPILEAFKSFAANPKTEILNKIKDIEDINDLVCPKSELPKKIKLDDGRLWVAVSNIKSIFRVLDEVGYSSYMLVAGNTGKGVVPILFYPKILIDITNITELRTHYIDINLVLGASTTLTDTMNIFHELSKTKENFWYLKILYEHLDRVAHIPVRNIGTLAGNLVVKHDHPVFQSDVFLLLDCVGATITLVDRNQRQTEVTLPQFLETDLKDKVLTQIKLPPLNRDYEIVTYKVAAKEQNAHAQVNSGFFFKFNRINNKIDEARIVYGGITPTFTHAYETENFLIGNNIFCNEVLQSALRILEGEINPNVNPPEPSPFYRRKVALGLFYKAVVRLCPKDILKPFYASAATTSYEDRPPVSRSYQEYDTDKKDYPITQPLLKREGLIQCSGEAVYSDDNPKIKDEVFASFVLSTVAKAHIESIDSSEVLLHTTVTRPVDQGYEVYSAAQYMDITQAAIAQILNIQESSVVVQTRRCGGAFGCKIARNNFAACATALVAWKLDKPCRMAMRLPHIMRVTGKRPNNILDYEVAVDDKGEIQYLDSTFYINDGNSSNENENTYATDSLQNCYDSRRWKVDSFATITDAPTNCFMRAPGGFQGISAIEHIMEHIAAEIQRNPISVRMANYRKDDNPLPELVPMFMERVDFKKREQEVKEFNAKNRWKKRAIKLTNMSFPTQYLGNYGALVSVYHGDGSVVVNIGGIEIGQGIFTKIAQTAANEFCIPVGKVSVLSSLNFATPNNFATGSSITSECCSYAVMRACQQIVARLAPVRLAMPNATWKEVVFEADRRGILLQANYQTSENDPGLQNYSIFGIAVIEVEIDVLTGTKWIVRADVFEDTGRSINPAIDVGQVEGAFVQALSLWTIEDIVYNEHSGELYTDRTWNYHITGAKDIPHDFRVYLRRRAPNPVGILGSKGVPVTAESVVKAADTKIEEYLLY
ncbi:uncharacterized protein LOC126375553 [Pectinophora gossypiella]|uniref:uncharacterized protein LOC126375553 n=1 Tax=Pectinophora gossypiella TaxID=13191 RepID=UPI00214F3948|nr:uncharacterized protein LOC126375553 [Pectinophora gossypiella]